jgi:hypothetical protein
MNAYVITRFDRDGFDEDEPVFVVIGEEADVVAKCRELNEASGERNHGWDGPIEYSSR